MDIQAKKYKTPNKEENQTALDFAQHIQGLKAMDNETTKPLGKEIREMGQEWWWGKLHLLCEALPVTWQGQGCVALLQRQPLIFSN